MNAALSAAIAGTLARALMAFLAGHGIDLGSDQANTIAQAALIVVPVIWGIVHKVKVNTAIKDAKAGY